MDEFFYSVPPITRSLVCFSGLMSILVGLMVIDSHNLIYSSAMILNRLQLWRLVTPFFYFGGPGFYLVSSLLAMYQYSLKLETGNFIHDKGAYAYFILLSLATLNIVKISKVFDFFPGDAMLMTMIYVWSISNAEQPVSFFFGVRFKALYLPYAYLAFNFLLGYQLSGYVVGITVGHLYYFLKNEYPRNRGPTLLATPSFIYYLFPRPNGTYRSNPVPPNINPFTSTFPGAGRRLA